MGVGTKKRDSRANKETEDEERGECRETVLDSEGAAWARRRRGKAADMLSDGFVKTLHKQMFGEVWKWGGTYRQNDLNMGIAPHLVPQEMPAILSDVRFWV